MRRSTALLVPLVVLAAVSLTAATVAQPVPGDGQQPFVANYANASSYLAIDGEEVSATDTVTAGTDAGLAVAIDARTLQSAHRMETFRHRFGEAASQENRSAAYDAVLTALEERAEALREHNDAMIRSYANGTISADSFVRERAVIVAEASRLQGIVSELEGVESETLGFDLSASQTSRLREVNGELAVLRGPVAERVAGLATGDSSSQSVYVETSTSGYVLALVDGDTYIREAYLGNEYDPTAEDQFRSADGSRLVNARQRALTLYPETGSASSSTEPFGSTYQYSGMKDNGRITVYLDGGTTNAFREGQRLNASTLPVGDVLSTANDSVRLAVDTTFPTGPMEVTLADNETDAPLDGIVTLDGEVLGRTGDDGSLWTIEPRDGAQIRATTADANLTVAVPGA